MLWNNKTQINEQRKKTNEKQKRKRYNEFSVLIGLQIYCENQTK